MGLTFTDRGNYHLYRLDGDRVPSVTTVINAGIPKPALIRWAPKVVAEAVAAMPSTVDAIRELGPEALVAALVALPNAQRNAAGRRGTEIHAWAERVVHGEPVEPPPDVAEAVAGYARWLDDFGFVEELVERIVGHRVCRYAGRFDLVGMLNGERWLLDVKTARGVYGDTSLQVAAYARAEFYVDDDGHERPMPRIDRIGVLHVQPDFTELYDMGSIDDGFAEFRAAQVIYAGAKRRDLLVEAPVQSADVRALF